MRQSAISFQASGLTFEGVVAAPDGGAGRIPGVVICHPHPLFGGNMDNNVVLAAAFALAEAGIATLRFNFRGVGNSEGEHAKGDNEHEEALAALDVLKAWPGVDGGKLGLAGYSFGSGVILRHPELYKEPKAIALISPSMPLLEATTLGNEKKPKFLITGGRDKLAAELPRFQATMRSYQHPPQVEIAPGIDHYWFDREDKLTDKLVPFFQQNLK